MSETPKLLTEATLEEMMSELEARGFAALLTGVRTSKVTEEDATGNVFMIWVGPLVVALGLVEYSKNQLLTDMGQAEDGDIADM